MTLPNYLTLHLLAQLTRAGAGVTTMYRAYNPTTGEHGTPYDTRARATAHAAARNQYALTVDGTQDWQVQTGTITWETP